MATALVALATTTLASSSATVTFSNISGAYRDLRLVIGSLTTTTNAQIYLRLNSDSGANYTYVTMNGNGSTTSSAAGTGETAFYLGYSMPAATVSNPIMDLMDYSATDKHKTTLVNRSNSGSEVIVMAQRWASTAAVTSLTITTSAGSMNAGTMLSLYGVLS